MQQTQPQGADLAPFLCQQENTLWGKLEIYSAKW